MNDRITILPGLSIGRDELVFTYARSSGPGGQNVNKVSTAVRLSFDPSSCKLLSDDVKNRLARLAGNRMNSAGVVTILAQRFRSQSQNRQDAVMRLLELLRMAAQKPAIRRKTRPSKASKERRLRYKTARSEKKQNRRTPLE